MNALPYWKCIQSLTEKILTKSVVFWIMGLFWKGSENYEAYTFTPGIRELYQEKCGDGHCHGRCADHLFSDSAG